MPSDTTEEALGGQVGAVIDVLAAYPVETTPGAQPGVVQSICRRRDGPGRYDSAKTRGKPPKKPAWTAQRRGPPWEEERDKGPYATA